MQTESLRKWFLENKRPFAWRNSPSPYQVLISEVMLQQTQASRVIDYYMRWMQRFGSIVDLAQSSELEVLKYWEGLGYYSRAILLHQAAIDIVCRFGGAIPDKKEELFSIKGLGPYTVGAILAFAFHQKEAAVDANVVRVLTRFFALDDDITKPKTQKKLFAIAESLLPEIKPWQISEALIELGALVCQKKPLCQMCPIKLQCQSFQKGLQLNFPVKSTKVQYSSLYRHVCVILSEDSLLVRKGKKGMPCADLYEFVYFDCDQSGLSIETLQEKIYAEFGIHAVFEDYLPEEKHSFTRYRVTLFPTLFFAEKKELKGLMWCNFDEAQNLPFNAGHKRIIRKLDVYQHSWKSC